MYETFEEFKHQHLLPFYDTVYYILFAHLWQRQRLIDYVSSNLLNETTAML
jgi:hypothetical protein